MQPLRLSMTDSGRLMPSHRRLIADLHANVAHGWSVQFEHDVNGAASILVMPCDLDDDMFPTLVITIGGATFRLEEVRDDNLRNLGEYQGWPAALDAVQVWTLEATAPGPTFH